METSVLIRDTGVKVTEILGDIARGKSYGQILEGNPKLILGDIMAAAQLAHDFMGQYITSEDVIKLDHVIELRTTAQSQFGRVNLGCLRAANAADPCVHPTPCG